MHQRVHESAAAINKSTRDAILTAVLNAQGGRSPKAQKPLLQPAHQYNDCLGSEGLRAQMSAKTVGGALSRHR